MSAAKYFYQDGSQEVGPLSRGILVKLYSSGRVGRQTIVRPDSGGEGVPLEALIAEDIRKIDERRRGVHWRAALCLLWCVAAWFCWVGFGTAQLSLARYLYVGVLLVMTGLFVALAARYAREVFGEARGVLIRYLARAFCVFNLLVGSLYVIVGVAVLAVTGYAFSWGHHQQYDWVTGERIYVPVEPVLVVAMLPQDMPLRSSRPQVGVSGEMVDPPNGAPLVLERQFNFDEPYDWRTIPKEELKVEGGFDWREISAPGSGGQR